MNKMHPISNKIKQIDYFNYMKSHYDYPSPTLIIGQRSTLIRIDLLFLVIESIDVMAPQKLLLISNKMGFNEIFPNRVEFWKTRSLNPLRKAPRRGTLNKDQFEAIIQMICIMAEKVYPVLRQLLSTKEPTEINKQRWEQLSLRINELIEERLNVKRSSVKKMLLNELELLTTKQLIITLALCAGSTGVDRLRATLLEPS